MAVKIKKRSRRSRQLLMKWKKLQYAENGAPVAGHVQDIWALRRKRALGVGVAAGAVVASAGVTVASKGTAAKAVGVIAGGAAAIKGGMSWRDRNVMIGRLHNSLEIVLGRPMHDNLRSMFGVYPFINIRGRNVYGTWEVSPGAVMVNTTLAGSRPGLVEAYQRVRTERILSHQRGGGRRIPSRARR